MMLLHRNAESLCFALTGEDRSVLGALLDLAERHPRQPPTLSRSASAGLPSDATEQLEKQLGECQTERLRRIRSWLAHRVTPAPPPGRRLHLILHWNEAELLLQALNSIRVGAWECLGSPDFEAGELPELTSRNMLHLWAIQVCESLLGVLLQALHAGDP